ncbi:MAG: 1-phosphofructokinase family hexose kinase [Thermoflexales bacterium]|nr:1-phosphofructokinase family hexose kinase [Thermoflexales bacterium]
MTPNTAVDRVLGVTRLIPDRTLRAQLLAVGPAGKGVCASMVAAELGYATTATGFAAGALGQWLVEDLKRRGITPAFVEVEGETRTNIVIIGSDDGTHTTLTSNTLQVHPAQAAQLVAQFGALVVQARCVVLGGSLPPGAPEDLYPVLIQRARQVGVPVILDASGEALRQGLSARPDWVKPNREELEQLVGRTVDSLEAALEAARAVQAQFGCSVLASLGAEGALVVSGEAVWRAHALAAPIVNPAGAGDALVAGLAIGLSERRPLPDGVRLGIAAATATLSRPGTAELSRRDVERWLGAVRLERWD